MIKYLVILPGLYEFSEDIYHEYHDFNSEQELEQFRCQLADKHQRYKGAVLAIPENRFHLLEDEDR